MRRNSCRATLAVVLTVIVLIGGGVLAHRQGVFVSSCIQDDDIEAEKRMAIETLAVDHVRNLIARDAQKASQMMSAEAQKTVTLEHLKSYSEQFVKVIKPDSIRVENTYLLRVVGTPPDRLICGENISKPSGWVAVSSGNFPEQAYVVIDGDTPNNKVAFTLWLVPGGGNWGVHSVWMNFVSHGQHGPDDLMNMARRERTLGHPFNAALLMAAAAQIADRGPNFQLGITPDILEEAQNFAVPEDIKGTPPYTWKTSEETFTVMQVGPLAIAGKLYVAILHKVPAWKTESEVEARNKRLLKLFKRRHPEYRDVFSGIVVRGHDEGSNRIWGTVEESPEPPPPGASKGHR